MRSAGLWLPAELLEVALEAAFLDRLGDAYWLWGWLLLWEMTEVVLLLCL